MPEPPLARTLTPSTGPARGPSLMPCLLLRKGQVCVPGPDGPVVALSPEGPPFDPFDVVDRLARDYSMMYVVDLDGLEHGDPQMDYLQEISRDVTLWVDGGVRTAEQAIDILITGARRAVLSSAYLRGPRQLKRAWRLSTELVFEMEIEPSGRLALADPSWGTEDPFELARIVREAGPDHLVVSPREVDPDWNLVARLAAGGPTWVDGSFNPQALPLLASAHATGGIFHIDDLLKHWNERPLPDPGPP
ncbi:MAG: HisA/HisF-related TIM barrel protein [Thermoplasmata archaeon]